MRFLLFGGFLVTFHIIRGEKRNLGEPKFLSEIANISIPEGREASLGCHVANANSYKVAWLRVDTQTILTMNELVITKNDRISVVRTEATEWRLVIKDTKPRDGGLYMCQINTEPMKSKMGYLEVVEPPKILDNSTSKDQTVRVGDRVTLSCQADGHPKPQIMWRREDRKPIQGKTEHRGEHIGPVITIPSVTRGDSGAYLCIAQNGVLPSRSRRILLQVEYAPEVTLDREEVTQRAGYPLNLTCRLTGYPRPATSWVIDNRTITTDGQFEIINQEVDFNTVISTLAITYFQSWQKVLRYKCLGVNHLGKSERHVTVKLIEPYREQVANQITIERREKDPVPALNDKRERTGWEMYETAGGRDNRRQTPHKDTNTWSKDRIRGESYGNPADGGQAGGPPVGGHYGNEKSYMFPPLSGSSDRRRVGLLNCGMHLMIIVFSLSCS